jgi:hypothetical protein
MQTQHLFKFLILMFSHQKYTSDFVCMLKEDVTSKFIPPTTTW